MKSDKAKVFNAIKRYDIAELKSLLSFDDRLIKARDGENMTPLHRAAQAGNVKTIDVLLGHGAELNARDEYGNTPLVFACSTKHTKAALHLINKGAEYNATLLNCVDFYSTEMSISPLEVACQKNLPKVVDRLLSKRVDKKVDRCLFCCAAQNNDDKVTPVLIMYHLKPCRHRDIRVMIFTGICQATSFILLTAYLCSWNNFFLSILPGPTNATI